MTKPTREWIKKAENDFKGVRLLSTSQSRLYDLSCFVCQQSVEKYLKALLVLQTQSIPKTHNLIVILTLVERYYPVLSKYRRGMDFLTRFAVETRYPGDDATKRQAEAAFRWATKIRAEVRTILKLKP